MPVLYSNRISFQGWEQFIKSDFGSCDSTFSVFCFVIWGGCPHRSLKNSVQIYTHIPGMRNTLIKSLCWLAEEKFFYLLFENWMVLICKTLILIHLRMLYASIRLKLVLWLWRSLFLNFVNVFSLFRNFLPWKSAWLFNWTILNPLQPRMLHI